VRRALASGQSNEGLLHADIALWEQHSNSKFIAIDMENDVAKKTRCLLGWLKKPAAVDYRY